MQKTTLADSSRLLPGVSTVPTHGFWFSPSLNAPISSDLLQTSQANSTPVNAINQLRSLTQGRYPFVPSLQSPFVPFPSTTLPSLFPPTSTSFEALKQLAFNNQSPANGYVNSLKIRENEKHGDDQVEVSLNFDELNRSKLIYETTSNYRKGFRTRDISRATLFGCTLSVRHRFITSCYLLKVSINRIDCTALKFSHFCRYFKPKSCNYRGYKWQMQSFKINMAQNLLDSSH